MRKIIIALLFVSSFVSCTDTHSPIINSSDEIANNVNNELLVYYVNLDGNPDIYKRALANDQMLRLTYDPGFDDSPALSPDGKWIVFLSARNDPDPHFPDLEYDLYLMDVDGQNMTRLTETESSENHPAWSPDSKKILFDADYDNDGFYEIYTMDKDGSNLTRLTNGASNDQFADWSPDGRLVAFASDRNGNWDIYTMQLDGSNLIQQTSSPDWELFPAWSPNGNLIAYNGLVPRSRNTDVFLMQSDGTNIKQLTDSPGFDENPTWSSDGNQIIFQTNRDGNFNLYSMNIDGRNQHAIINTPTDELWPSMSR